MNKLNIIYSNNEEVLSVVQSHNVPFLQFQELKMIDFIKHGFSTRLGGVSKGKFTSMNLGFGRGDEVELVLENFERIGNGIGMKKETMVCGNQTHTTNVHVVDESLLGNGVVKPNMLTNIDGLITNIPGICLTTFYADCVPLYLIDVKKKVIGLSHSGWKGTVGKIGAATVKKMAEEYGSKPEDIHVAIGPSICQKCYEVSEDVINEFRNAFPKEAWDSLFYQKRNGKYQLDLWKANELIFINVGILQENISTTNICTCCNSELLFSHRASHGERGNLAAFLAISKEGN